MGRASGLVQLANEECISAVLPWKEHTGCYATAEKENYILCYSSVLRRAKCYYEQEIFLKYFQGL